jgi:hypothetical protein
LLGHQRRERDRGKCIGPGTKQGLARLGGRDFGLGELGAGSLCFGFQWRNALLRGGKVSGNFFGRSF